MIVLLLAAPLWIAVHVDIAGTRVRAVLVLRRGMGG
jgi:hypothetical protein